MVTISFTPSPTPGIHPAPRASPAATPVRTVLTVERRVTANDALATACRNKSESFDNLAPDDEVKA